MSPKKWENECGIPVVCVDRYEDRIPEGRFYNQVYPDGVQFNGVMDFLRKMEQMLEKTRLPQANGVRTFANTPMAEPQIPEGGRSHEGECGTFAVRVLFLQNASWQGNISWLEGYREESFRSVLELLLLIDSALSAE